MSWLYALSGSHAFRRTLICHYQNVPTHLLWVSLFCLLCLFRKHLDRGITAHYRLTMLWTPMFTCLHGPMLHYLLGKSPGVEWQSLLSSPFSETASFSEFPGSVSRWSPPLQHPQPLGVAVFAFSHSGTCLAAPPSGFNLMTVTLSTFPVLRCYLSVFFHEVSAADILAFFKKI